MSTLDKKKLVDRTLTDLYYQTTHMWKGNKAIELLLKKTKIAKKWVIQWISLQALWQVFLPDPKHIVRRHFDITKVNQMHQVDLLYLPHDKVYGNIYKYVLCVEDVASRYKAGRPLKTKKSSEVVDMLKDIYRKGPLKLPEIFQCDNGSEFKGDVTKLLTKHNVEIKRATTKYHHRFTAFVERMNKTLAERLFKIQDAQELNDPKKHSKTWARHLQNIIRKMNNEITAMIKMKPKDAIKLNYVKLKVKEIHENDVLPEDGLYRYLYQPGELEGGQQRRATDMIWSWNTFRLDKIIQDKGQRVLYYLRDGPKRSFVREELMLIPEETQLPPDYVQEWS